MYFTKSNYIKKFKFSKIILLLVFILVPVFFGGKIWIILEANSMGKKASLVFQEDKIESLLLLIDTDSYTLKEKNNAIWALGVLKDERALSKLEMLYTGEPCNHEKSLCQYEIKKAILKIKGEFHGSFQINN